MPSGPSSLQGTWWARQCQRQRGLPRVGPWGHLHLRSLSLPQAGGTILISKKGTEITFRSKNDFSVKQKWTFCGLSPVSLEVWGLSCLFFPCFLERTGDFLRCAHQVDAVTRGCTGHRGDADQGNEPCSHFCLSGCRPLKARSWKAGTVGD